MRDIVERLRGTTRSMAFLCSVDMGLWDDHSNACLEAISEIERLRKDFSDASEDYHAVMSVIGTKSIADVPDLMAAKDAEIEKWRHAFAAQSCKLQRVIHIPGVREALADTSEDDTNAESTDEITRLRALNAEMEGMLEAWCSDYDGWSQAELEKRADPATIKRYRKARAILAKASGPAYPVSPRLLPDGSGYVCDECGRTWAVGETSGCEPCRDALAKEEGGTDG